MAKFLDGVKVVNLAYNLPGPLAASELSKYGALVTKVEPPGGDPFEQFCLEWYQELITGQEILQLDLKANRDLNTFMALIADADLLITSLRPSALKRLGLGWEVLESRFPRLCHVEILGYPPPDEEIPGHDLTYQAEHGLVTPPDLPRSLYSDIFGAQKSVQAALLLIIQRNATGKSSRMPVYLAEAVSGLSATVHYQLTRAGDLLGGGFARYNLYKTRDGWIALAALEDKFWLNLIAALNLTDEQATKETLDEIFIQRETEAWINWAAEEDLPISAVT